MGNFLFILYRRLRENQKQNRRIVRKFFITDQEGLPVSGAEISFKAFGLTFITDDGGRTENVSLSVNADDCADGWYGTTVVVRAEKKSR